MRPRVQGAASAATTRGPRAPWFTRTLTRARSLAPLASESVRKYEKYLLDVVDNATDGEYDEIAEVVNRHNTLEGANVVRLPRGPVRGLCTCQRAVADAAAIVCRRRT